MLVTREMLMSYPLEALEAATGREAGDPQISAALALCEVVTNRRVVAHVDSPEYALLVAALAAAALADTEWKGSIDLVVRDAADAESVMQVFQSSQRLKRVNIAPAESLVFQYLKEEQAHPLESRCAIVVNADQTLVRDDHTPVILAATHAIEPAAVSPETQAEAERTLQNERDYVVQDGRIVIRDPETGALFPGRRFTRGLQAAVEKREGLPATEDGDCIQQIRMGDYFRQYGALVAVSVSLELTEQYASLYGMKGR